jgi:hypothetical protein
MSESERKPRPWYYFWGNRTAPALKPFFPCMSGGYRMEFHMKRIAKTEEPWSVHRHPVVKKAETRISVIPWYRNKKNE